MVQVLFLLSTISMAISAKVAQKIASKFGRLQTTLLCKWVAVVLFVVMVALYQNNAPVCLVCVLWIIRTATVNSTGPLTKSVLMDSVSAKERAKWSALESVNMCGWAGSAALGGFLVDWCGIEFNFYLTAGCQFLATIPIVCLLGRVPKE